MKTLRLIFVLALLAWAGNADAADWLGISVFSIAPGETKTVSVLLENPASSYTLLEFCLTLPEGITIDSDEDGYLMATPNGMRFTRSHRLEIERSDAGYYKVLIYSSNNAALAGNTGELFSITLTASAQLIEGTYEGRFHDQLFVDMNQEGYEPEPSTFAINVASSVKGDTNRDGKIDVADVTAQVNIINGNAGSGQYDTQAADMDDNGSVGTDDVRALVRLILDKP